MLAKEISLPKALHELHGERTRLSTLALVYLAGLAAAGVVAWQLLSAGLAAWQIALASLLFLDIGGGVVANLSTSTNQYYQRKPGLRVTFLLLHILQPALLALAFSAVLPYTIFTAGFTLGTALLVNTAKDTEFQQNIAAALLTGGICLSFLFALPHPVLYAFAPLFMIKLILGFAVRRPAFC